ncbi:exodeoxyribonuclease V gamma chain domain protein [Mycobacterium xenopi 4042]|uniref:Exodeoxyribonuclease V gamma chain domain protein n=1 Tax=Mycobacterium xenopi 4042 TaxID=1299334 RepID=X8BKT9_MYCXE|nr:exodeoxyribonuclease V gamma chain domain protein [Mycobacterium xenopi 4042]
MPGHRDLRAADRRQLGLGETAADSHPAHRLRVKLADRALNQTTRCSRSPRRCWPSRGPRHRQPGARPGAGCAGAGPVPERRPRRDHRLGAQCQYPLGFDQCHRRPTGWATSCTTPGGSGSTAS